MSGETSVVRSVELSDATMRKSLSSFAPATSTRAPGSLAIGARWSPATVSTCTVSTRAALGCCVLSASTNESTAARGPRASMCTPSEALRTQPARPRAVARPHTNGR